MHDEVLQHLLHEQTSQLREFNYQLQEEIKKRQLLESKLQTSEAKIRAVFEAMTDLVLVINTQGNQIKNIEILPTSTNHLYEADLIDNTVKYFFQNKTAKTWGQNIWQALDKKQTLNFDYKLSLNGHEVWFSASISPISDQSVIWVARDISERKQAEAEKTALIHRLQQSEHCLSQILASVATSIIVQDQQTHQVVFANAAAIALFEQPYEQLLGKLLDLPVMSGAVTEVDLTFPSGKSVIAEMRTVDIIWENQAASLITFKDITERKRVEEELRRSEERWQLVIQGNNDGVWDLNLQTNKVFRSARFAQMLGYEAQEIGEDNEAWSSRLHPDDLERVMQANQDYLKRKIPFYDLEYRLRCKDGSYKWILGRAQAVWEQAGHPVRMVGTTSDISDRKLAEAKLKKSEASLTFAQEVAHVGNWEFNILTQKIAWSAEMFRIFGLEPTQPEPTLAEHIEQIYPEDRALWHKTVGHALKSGQAYKFDFRIVRSNGQVRYVEARGRTNVNEAGQVIQLFGTVMDITDRKLSEEQLSWQEALMRSITSVSPLAFFVVDNRTDAILYSNHRFCEIWGIEHLEERIKLCQLKNNDIIPDCLSCLADVPAFAESCKPLQSEENRVVVEDEIPFVDGRTIRRFSTQVRDLEDHYFGRLYIFEDITHRKIAEAALRQSEAREREKAQALEQVIKELKLTQAQLIQSEKMSSLGQMVAGIAHEINNPTSFIYGNIYPATNYAQDLLELIELYRQHYPQPVAEITEHLKLIEPDFIAEDFPKLLASMKEGASRINQIVLSLRNFSRLDESQSKCVDIHEGIDNTLLILNHRLKQQSQYREIKLIKEYGQLPLVECYPGQLNQVFMNIISNGIDALDKARSKDCNFEPTIQICTTLINIDSHSSHSHNQNLSRVMIRITDNSPSSIKEELLPKIFDPFFTTKPVGSGKGLGLSISYQIVVERHRGQLRCYSTPGVGTEFVIELPIP